MSTITWVLVAYIVLQQVSRVLLWLAGRVLHRREVDAMLVSFGRQSSALSLASTCASFDGQALRVGCTISCATVTCGGCSSA